MLRRVGKFVCTGLLLASCTGGGAERHWHEGVELARQHRTAEAMRQFRLAIESDDDVHSVAQATAELGRLYLGRHELVPAANYFGQALQQADGQDDVALRVLARRDMGRLSRAADRQDEALRWFAQADSLIGVTRADTLCEQVYPEYLSLLIAAGRAEEARALMRRWPVDVTSGPSCLVAGRFYRQLGQTDSAAYYLEHCLATDHVSARASAAMFLSEMAMDGDDASQAYAYAMECAVMVDSAKHEMQRENANLVASLSAQIEVERENSRLRLWLAAAVALIVGLSVATVFYVRWRMERMRHREEARREARRQQAHSRQEELTTLFRDTPLYRHVLQEGTMDSTQWDDLMRFLDEQASHFPSALQTFYPRIKPIELQACCLLKLEFTNLQIANILCKTQQAITNLRKRLFQKMFDREGTAEELNQFIRLFPDENDAFVKPL